MARPMYIWQDDLSYLKKEAKNLDDFFRNLLVDKMMACCGELQELVAADDHSLACLKKIIRLEWNVNQLLYLYATGRNFATIPLDVTQWYEDIDHSPIDLSSFYDDQTYLREPRPQWLIISAMQGKGA